MWFVARTAGYFFIIERRDSRYVLNMSPQRMFTSFGFRISTTIWIVLLVAIVCVARAPAVSAAGTVGAVTGERPAAEGSVLSQWKQYHYGSPVQYQEHRGLSRPVSAWYRGLNRARELASTSTLPFFDFDFVVSNANQQKAAISRSDSPIGIANDRSIDGQILTRTCPRRSCFSQPDPVVAGDTTNERLMLQLGGLFGMFYVAFLAVWFWATRIRGRPPSGAHT
jgi:hypothetical protein